MLAGLAAFVGLGAAGMFGARTESVTGGAAGDELTVMYPGVTRPGLAIRWVAVVHRDGGFEGPITVATTSGYFDLFDLNGLDPTPAASTTVGELSLWMFDRPPGDTLRVVFDGRLEPARQWGTEAITSLVIGGRTIVSVRYETRVMP